MFRVVALLLSLCMLAACGRGAAGTGKPGDPSGTWIGDFGPAFYDRNTIALELKWDGTNLTGTIQPGDPKGRMFRNFKAFPIENGSFDPKTRLVKFQASFKPRSRDYDVEGHLDGDNLTGTWNRPSEPGKSGDFKLKRK